MRRLIRIIPIALIAAACGLLPQPQTPNQAPSTQHCAGASDTVTRVYAELLKRTPDAAGLSHYQAELCAGRLTEAVMREQVQAGDEYKALHAPPVTPPPPPPSTAVVKWGGVVGASYYTAMTDERVDLDRYGQYFEDNGVTFTRVFAFDGWALGQRDGAGKFLPGQHDGFIPWVRLPNGKFDLDQFNEAYFTRQRLFVDTMNRHGVFVHLTILDLYSWSQRKAGLLYVPDPNLGPFRNNVNGVRWGDPDDPTLYTLPDTHMKRFICRTVDNLHGAVWVAQIGNEFPEKEAHVRMAAALRTCGYSGEITVNRNEDKPGQYWNMQIDKGRYDRIEFHGKLTLDYLDEDHDEGTTDRPRTFRGFWASPKIDPARVIMSSDGGSSDPKRLPDLQKVACDALKRGANYEHQLTLKRRLFFGDGSLQMADLEIDRAFLKSLAACRPQ